MQEGDDNGPGGYADNGEPERMVRVSTENGWHHRKQQWTEMHRRVGADECSDEPDKGDAKCPGEYRSVGDALMCSCCHGVSNGSDLDQRE